MENIANKIRKIIAKADGTTHAEEAATFMERAHRMMEQHGLSLLDLGRLDQDDPLGKSDGPECSTSEIWRRNLASMVARYFGCRIMSLRGNRRVQMIVYGRESARLTFALMWPFVERQVMELARRDRHLHSTSGDTRAARRAIGVGLIYRLSDMIRERDTSDAKGDRASQVNALVPVDLIEGMMDADHPTSKLVGMRAKPISAAALRAAGEVSLAMQADGRATRRIT